MPVPSTLGTGPLAVLLGIVRAFAPAPAPARPRPRRSTDMSARHHVSQLEPDLLTLTLIKRFEGYRASAYQDVGGVWTVGYGHTPSFAGETVTPEQAMVYLRGDIETVQNQLARLVTVWLTQYEYTALVSLVYNIGAGNFARSTLLKKLNREDYTGAAAEFKKWRLVQGRIVRGLQIRRRVEEMIFTTPSTVADLNGYVESATAAFGGTSSSPSTPSTPSTPSAPADQDGEPDVPTYIPGHGDGTWSWVALAVVAIGGYVLYNR